MGCRGRRASLPATAGHSHCAHADTCATAWKGGGKRACLAFSGSVAPWR